MISLKMCVQRLADLPLRVVTLKVGEVADVTNVVALAILVDVFVSHLLSGQLLNMVKSFQKPGYCVTLKD